MDGWMDAVFCFRTWVLCVRACVRQRERDKNRSCVRVHVPKVESRELVRPVFFCFLVSGRFDSIRSFVLTQIFPFFPFVYFVFGGRGKERRLS